MKEIEAALHTRPPFAVGREHGLLQHILEHALAKRDEVDLGRRRFPTEQPTQVLEVLAGEKARWGEKRDESARTCLANGQIGEYAVKVRVPVEAAGKARATVGRQTQFAIRWIAHHQIESALLNRVIEAIAHFDDFPDSPAAGHDDLERSHFDKYLGQPCRKRVQFKATQTSVDILNSDGWRTISQGIENSRDRGNEKCSRSRCRVEDVRFSPFRAGAIRLVE